MNIGNKLKVKVQEGNATFDTSGGTERPDAKSDTFAFCPGAVIAARATACANVVAVGDEVLQGGSQPMPRLSTEVGIPLDPLLTTESGSVRG